MAVKGKGFERFKNGNSNNKATPVPNGKVRGNGFADDKLISSVDFNTLQADYARVGGIIESTYSGWQDPTTMQSNKQEVESMYHRLLDLQKYNSTYGQNALKGVDDMVNAYNEVLGDWDERATAYGYYKTADAFNEAQKKAVFDKQFAGLSFEDVQEELKKYDKSSDEYAYLRKYTNYSNLNDFDKAVEKDYAFGSRQMSTFEDMADYYKKLKEKRRQYALDHTFDRYEHYTEAEDFAEKSQYNSTYYEKVSRGYLIRGYEDPVYQYLNLDSMDDEEYDKNGIRQRYDTPSSRAKGYQNIEPEELAVYNYIYNTEGKKAAHNYLEDMEIMLAKRAYEEDKAEIEAAVDHDAATATILSLLSIPMGLAGGVSSILSSGMDLLQGKEYNPYSLGKKAANIATDTRQYVGENIIEETEDWEWANVGGTNIPEFLYQTAMSMGDSAASMLAFGPMGSALLAGPAFTSKAKELKEAGASEGRIWTGAVTSALLEFAFERIGAERLFKVKNADSFRKVFTEALKQGGIEAVEEMGTEYSNMLADSVYNEIFRENLPSWQTSYKEYRDRGFSASEAGWKVAGEAGSQIAWAGLGGFISGNVMGGVSTANQYQGLKSTGAEVRANNRVPDLIEGVMNDKESQAFQLYTEMSKKGISASNITDAQIGNLYATTSKEIQDITHDKKMDYVEKSERVNPKLAVLNKVSNKKDTSSKTLNEHADGMSDDRRELFLNSYDGESDIEDYTRSFDLAYTYGELGYGSDSVLRNKGVLTEAQATAIYEEGMRHANKVKEQQRTDITDAQARNLTVKGVVDDSVINYGKGTVKGKINWSDMTYTQRQAVNFTKLFAKATGANVTFFISDVKDGKRQGKNGSYDPAKNLIEIDLYAGVEGLSNTKDFIIPVLSHEITHWMEQKAPNAYRKLSEFVLNSLEADGISSTNRIADEIRLIKENHPEYKEVTAEMAINEIVARACEDAIANSNKMRQMLSSMSKAEQKSFIEKIKETFDNLLDWVNNLMSKYKSSTPEAEFLRGYKNSLEEMVKLWDATLDEAMKAEPKVEKKGAVEQHSDGRVIKEGMTDEERYQILKNRSIVLTAKTNTSKMKLLEGKYNLSQVHTLNTSGKKKLFVKIGEEFGVFKKYNNKNVKLTFDFSRGNMKESLNKQKGDLTSFGKMLSCLDKVIETAVGIEVHNRNQEGYKIDPTLNAVYVLVGAFEDGKYIIPVKLEIKEFVDKDNTLYIAIALGRIKIDEVVKQGNTKDGVTQYSRPSKVNLAQLFSKINPSDESFLKYVPKQFLQTEQNSDHDSAGNSLSDGKTIGNIMFSDRQTRSMDDDDYSKLKSHFGTTKDFNVAGYMLPDGTMLDFSGKHWGGNAPNFRQVDHRDVWEAWEDYDRDGMDEMVSMIANGNIRLMPEIGGINLAVKPTDEQRSMLENYIAHFKGEVVVDIDAVGGDTVKSFTYEKGTSADVIMKDIDNYFRGGRTSDLMQFHVQYSDRAAYDNSEDEDFYNYAQDVLDGIKKKKPYILSETISKRFAADIKRIIGISVEEYSNAIHPSEIEHIAKRHGKNGITDHSMADLHDLAKIKYVLENYSDIEEGTKRAHYRNSDGTYARTVLLQAKIDEEYYYVVEAVPDSMKKKLLVVTAFRNKKDIFAEGVNATNGPNLNAQGGAQSNTSFNNNIPPSSKNTTTFSQFSDRTTDTTAEILGEKARLEKENSALKADIARLRERLALERKVTGGNTFNENLLDAAARHIRAMAKSDYDIKQLKEEMRDVYTYIATTENLSWDVLMAKCDDVARSILQKQRGTKVVNSYFRDLQNEFRKTRVSLTEAQIQEAKYLYGDKYRDVFFGKIILAKDAINLDSQWMEWAHEYPELFREDATPGDQVSELLNILDSVRESAVTLEKFNDMQTVRELAAEIYNQYWNVSTVKTTADKYDQQIKKLNFEHRQAMTGMRNDFKKRLDDQKLADRIHYTGVINKVRARRDADVKRARELGREHIAELRDRQERNRRIRSITKKALSLNEMLVRNSKDKHIPEVMKNAVAYLIDAIDFSSQQLLGQRGGDYRFQPTNKDISLSKALEQVHQMAVDLDSSSITAESINEAFDYVDLPLGFADDILALSKNVNDILRTVGDNQYVLNEMTADQLTELDHIFKVLKHSVSALNKFHTVAHDAGVADLAGNSMEYSDSLGQDKEHSELVDKLRKTVSWNNALPYYVFKRFGEGGVKIFEAMQDGWDKFAFRIKDIIDFTEGVYTEDEVKQWSKQVEEFSIPLPATAEQAADPDYIPTEQTMMMTHAQIMSLYCLWKREQAKGHILGGGIRVADFEDAKKKTVKQTNGINLTEQNVADIIGRLSPREIEVADALQEFMNTTSKQWGNEVSMLRYGYEAFGEENYFPIQTESNDRTTNDKDMNESSLFRLLNMSFTKETNRKANNKLVVNDIFDVFANHASDMAKYNTLALPVLDMLKWYNYKENIEVGDDSYTTKSVKASLEAAFGKDAKNYITTLIKDINGEKTGGRDTLGGDLFSKAKVAAVGGNIRVVALQPTAYFRAGALMNPKYMTAAFMRAPKVSLAKDHCGIALWKSLGFYDTNIQRDVTSLIKHDATAVDKAVELSMKAAGKADEVTWGYLWNACELETQDIRKDLRVGSEEYYQVVAKRLRDIIYSTQVVDSTMTRSQMMRSSGMYDKMLTAFMSEPTISLNLVQDAVYQFKLTERQTNRATAIKKHLRPIARTMAAYTMTNVICALVEAGFDAFREEDDEADETFILRWWENFVMDQSFLNKVPYIKDALSLLQGYTSARTDQQWMTHLKNTYSGFMKMFDEEGNGGNPYTVWKNFIRFGSTVSGLPIYNVYRDMMAGLDKTELLTHEEIEELWNEFIGDVFPSLNIKE